MSPATAIRSASRLWITQGFLGQPLQPGRNCLQTKATFGSTRDQRAQNQTLDASERRAYARDFLSYHSGAPTPSCSSWSSRAPSLKCSYWFQLDNNLGPRFAGRKSMFSGREQERVERAAKDTYLQFRYLHRTHWRPQQQRQGRDRCWGFGSTSKAPFGCSGSSATAPQLVLELTLVVVL